MVKLDPAPANENPANENPANENPADRNPADELGRQLSSIQRRLDEISRILQEQVSLQRERAAYRWRPSLRLLLILMAALAGMAAWFGSEFRHARMQDEAISILISHGAGVQLTPSESLLAALMPGSPAEPPAVVRRALGREFFTCLSQVSISGGFHSKSDIAEIRKALKIASRIQGLRLRNVGLKTEDLAEVFELSELESLDVSHSQLDRAPIPGISNTQLRWFDGSHTQLGDQAAYDLSFCYDLVYLNLDRTTLTDTGLEYLVGLKSLKQLSVKRTRVSLAAIQKFADARPDCFIEYQPLRFKPNGIQDVNASMRGSKTFGVPNTMLNASPPSHRSMNPGGIN